MSKIERDEKVLLLAYDHGLEHGPKDFKEWNVNPEDVLEIAESGPYTGLVMQKGLAEKYYSSYDVPLVLKVNGKTALNPKTRSSLNCSVERAVELGADAVGFTIYPGSEFESEMQENFRLVQERAREYDLPVILWSYPRGEGINEKNPETVAYAARIALELGADYVKVKYPGSAGSFAWAVENAGKTKVLCSGGSREPDQKFIERVKAVMEAGACGLAVGRNVWQREEPVELSDRIEEIVFG